MAPKSSYGSFRDVGEAIRSFIFDRLEGSTIKPNGPKLFNVTQSFSAFLADNEVGEIAANEIAAEQNGLLWIHIRRRIERWHGQGVTPPFAETAEIEDVLVTWRHDNYERHTGALAPKHELFEIYSWLGGLQEKDFHLPCLCYLRVLGCDPIFLTDGGFDEGIDCIGVVSKGPIRSTVVFVQAKSSLKWCSGDEVRLECTKYLGLPRTEKYMKYLNALGVVNSSTGAGYLYTIILNSDITFSASAAANKLGALLRSRWQLANTLAAHYSLKDLLALREAVQLPNGPDLSQNLAPLLAMA